MSNVTNVRMGLSAHLEGVMKGILLLALGAVWNEVRLPNPVKVTAYCTALYGTYGNLASDLDGCGFRDRGRFSNHFSRPRQESLLVRASPFVYALPRAAERTLVVAAG